MTLPGAVDPAGVPAIAAVVPLPPIDVGAIAFDLVGTLLDTVHELAAAVNALLTELGYPPLAKEIVGTLIGKGMANLVRRSLALATGISPDAVDDFYEDGSMDGIDLFTRREVNCFAVGRNRN